MKTIMLIFILIWLSGVIFSCSCIRPGTPAQELEKADAVFVGTAVIVDEQDYSKVIYFDLQKLYKGNVSNKITVHTPSQSAACGYEFQKGKQYLIYTHLDENNDLQVNLCSRTALVEDATEDLSSLKEIPAVSTPTATSTDNSFYLFLIPAFVLLVGLFFWIKKAKS